MNQDAIIPIFKLNTDLLEWKLRTAQEKFEDPIKKVIQNSLDASCTLMLRSNGKTWTGSGFHVGNGLVVTAAHVAPEDLLSTPYEIFITFDGQNALPANVVASESDFDAAVLYCPGAVKVPPVMLADSSTVEVGDIISVIGSPEGWHDTATVGRVSNVNQQLGAFAPSQAWNDIIFIDADILPGASGGMVVGTDGRVVGLVMGVTGQLAEIGIGERAVCPSNKIAALLNSISQ